MNFRRWNYNCAFYYILLSENVQIFLNKQEQHFTFVRMGNLPTAKRDATGKQIFDEMSNKRQL
jgi:hypothetical protein